MAICPHCEIELPDVPTGGYRSPSHDRMECIENLQSDKRRLRAENEQLRKLFEAEKDRTAQMMTILEEIENEADCIPSSAHEAAYHLGKIAVLVGLGA